MTLARFLQVFQTVLQYPIFTINRTTVTMTSVLLVIAVMAAVMIASKVVVRTLIGKLLTRTNLDEGTQYTLTQITHYLMLIMGAVVAFQIVGIDLSGLIVIFGFLSVGIGFGLQNVTSNFISGLILLLERPITVGDRVLVGDTEGDVVEIHIRSTIVKTQNNVSIIVPNSEFISSNVINMSHADPKLRLDIGIGVSYDSDLDSVMQTLMEIATAESEVLDTPTPEVLLLEFGDSAWNMELRVWIENPKRHWQVRSAINCAIVHRFREKGIEIPFPQRDLHVRSPLPLPVNNNPRISSGATVESK